MASKRKYPPRKCINPACGKLFDPHDDRQIFCCAQCRIDFNNDKRKMENTERYGLEKKLRIKEKALEKIMAMDFYKAHNSIHEQFLIYEGIELALNTHISINAQTNNPIIWAHNMGHELIDHKNRFYTLHKIDKSISNDKSPNNPV